MPKLHHASSVVLGIVAILPLLGCSSSPSGVACEDPQTTEKVLTLAKADLVKKVGQDVATKTELSLHDISTTGQQGTRFECRAQLDSQYPSETKLPSARLPITFVSETHSETGHSVRIIGL